MLAKRFPTVIRDLRGGLFERGIIENSVVISMAKSNAENFPNHGNGRHATAGWKCLLLVTVLSGKPLDFQIHAARAFVHAITLLWWRKRVLPARRIPINA